MSKIKINTALVGHRPTALLAAALFQAAVMLSHPASAQNKQSSQVSIEANVSLEWDQTKGVYIAIGDAVVVQDDKNLKADKIIARYDPSINGRDLTDISATGSVVFVDGDSVARGAKLDYRIGDKREFSEQCKCHHRKLHARGFGHFSQRHRTRGFNGRSDLFHR